MAAALEPRHHVARDGRLDAELVRYPLVVEARGRHRLLHVHPVVDDVEDREQDGGDDARAAGAARHHEGLAIFDQDRRRHARERPLARSNRIGAARIDQPIGVRRVGRDREVVHFVVEHDPRTRNGDAGAVGGVDGRRDRYRVPVLVRDGQVSRSGVIVRQTRADDFERYVIALPAPGRRREGAGVDARPLCLGVLLPEQALERDLHEVGIAQVGSAIREGELHRLGDDVEAGRATRPARAEIEALEDVEHLEQHDAARGRRRKRVDLDPPVRARHRTAFDGSVGRQVGGTHDAAAARHLVGHLPGNLARVEDRRPLLGNGGQGAGEILLHEQRARLDSTGAAALRRELDPRRLGEALRRQPGLHVAGHARLIGTERKPRGGQPNRWLEHAGKRQCPVLFLHHRQTRHHPGSRYGERTVDGGALGQVGLQVHVARRRSRSGFASVERDQLAVGQSNQDERATAQARREGLRDPDGEGRRNRGVDRVAPDREHLGTRASRVGRGTHHHPLASQARRTRGRVRGVGRTQECGECAIARQPERRSGRRAPGNTTRKAYAQMGDSPNKSASHRPKLSHRPETEPA